MNTSRIAKNGASLVAEGSVESYAFRIFERAGFRFSYTQVVGPINLNTRVQLYRQTLPFVVAGTYFGILDNSEGFENDFCLEAIQFLDTILINRGVRKYFGATITSDGGYSKIVKLAQTNMETVGLEGAVITVPNSAAALDFILGKIDAIAGTVG